MADGRLSCAKSWSISTFARVENAFVARFRQFRIAQFPLWLPCKMWRICGQWRNKNPLYFSVERVRALCSIGSTVAVLTTIGG